MIHPLLLLTTFVALLLAPRASAVEVPGGMRYQKFNYKRGNQMKRLRKRHVLETAARHRQTASEFAEFNTQASSNPSHAVPQHLSEEPAFIQVESSTTATKTNKKRHLPAYYSKNRHADAVRFKVQEHIAAQRADDQLMSESGTLPSPSIVAALSALEVETTTQHHQNQRLRSNAKWGAGVRLVGSAAKVVYVLLVLFYFYVHVPR